MRTRPTLLVGFESRHSRHYLHEAFLILRHCYCGSIEPMVYFRHLTGTAGSFSVSIIQNGSNGGSGLVN